MTFLRLFIGVSYIVWLLLWCYSTGVLFIKLYDWFDNKLNDKWYSYILSILGFYLIINLYILSIALFIVIITNGDK
jgi:hypothetical protein